MYYVKDDNGSKHAFDDVFDAMVKIDEIVNTVLRELLIEYDCCVDYSGGSMVTVLGRERDRFGIHDRRLYAVWLDPVVSTPF